MNTKFVVMLSAVLLLCLAPIAGAFPITFTGNVDADFTGLPLIQSRPDVVADPIAGGAGTDDAPLDQSAFVSPPPAELMIPPSGFNLERVVSFYESATDTLYLGLDVADGKIAWDADGNGNITTHNPAIVPGSMLREMFSDDGMEEYRIELDVNPSAYYSPDMRILVLSDDGGVTVQTVAPIRPAGVTVDSTFTGSDVELAIHGLAQALQLPSQTSIPVRILTRSGSYSDYSGEDYTDSVVEMAYPIMMALTGDVEADFKDDPRLIACPDVWSDSRTGLAGTEDEPLGPDAFEIPRPASNIIPPSGFNIGQVLCLLDSDQDILYVGLDIASGKIAWDADGDGGILTKKRSIVPGFTLLDVFRDTGMEAYEVYLDIGRDGSTDISIFVESHNGGATVTTRMDAAAPGISIDPAITGSDVELTIRGVLSAFPLAPYQQALPIAIKTMSGAFSDLSANDITGQAVDLPSTFFTCLSLDSGASCCEQGPFKQSAALMTGDRMYVRSTVSNCGTEPLADFTITSTLSGNLAYGYDDTVICTVTDDQVLVPGESRSYLTSVTTDQFNLSDVSADCTVNTVVTLNRPDPWPQWTSEPSAIGVNILVPSSAIGSCRQIEDGSQVRLEGKVVTAGNEILPGLFYVEEENRASGIQVVTTTPVWTNDIVYVSGTMRTNDDGERYILAGEVGTTNCPGTAPSPLGMRCNDVGGGALGLGTNNVGLLIKVWGKVTATGEGCFYVSDGSNLNDGLSGLKVLGAVPVPEGTDPVGQYVAVTGISSCYKIGAHTYRLLRATNVELRER